MIIWSFSVILNTESAILQKFSLGHFQAIKWLQTPLNLNVNRLTLRSSGKTTKIVDRRRPSTFFVTFFLIFSLFFLTRYPGGVSQCWATEILRREARRKKSLLHSAATPPPYHTALESCTPSQLINPYRNFRWFVRTVHLFFQKIFFREKLLSQYTHCPIIHNAIKIHVNIFLLIDFICSFTNERSES